MLNFTPIKFYDRCVQNNMLNKGQETTGYTKSMDNNYSDLFIQNNKQISSKVAFAGILNTLGLSKKKEITNIEKMDIEMPEGSIEEVAEEIAKTQDKDKKIKQTIKFINENKEYLFDKDGKRPAYFGERYDLYEDGNALKDLREQYCDLYKNGDILKKLIGSFVKDPLSKYETSYQNDLFNLMLQKDDYDYHRTVLENLNLNDKDAQKIFYQIIDNSDDICRQRQNHFLMLGFNRDKDFPKDQQEEAYIELKKRVWNGYKYGR